jgi:adenylate cyclase
MAGSPPASGSWEAAPERRLLPRWAGAFASLGAGAAVTLLVAVLCAAGLFEELEEKAYDIRLRLTAEPARAHPDVVLVMIGQASLDFFARVSPDSGTWPWTRDYYIPVVEYCRRGGAKAVLFDLIFTEQSRVFAHDVELGRASRRPSRDAAAVFMAAPFMRGREEKPPAIPDRFAVRVDTAPGAVLPAYGSVRLPVAPLLHVQTPVEGKEGQYEERVEGGVRVGAISGIGDVFLDKGGRYQPVLCHYEGRFYPSLAFAAFLDRVFPGYFERPPEGRPALSLDASNRLVLPAEPPVTLPLSGDGRMLVSFRGPETYATGRLSEPRRRTYVRYEIADVIGSYNNVTSEPPAKPIVPPEAFAGKLVLVGADAPGLDMKASPFGEWPGALFHAAALDTCLRGDFRVRWPRGAAVGIVLALGLAVSALARIRSAALGAAGSVVLIAAYGGFSVWALPGLGAWVEAVAPLVAGVLAAGTSATVNYLHEGREKRFVSRAFQHFVPPVVVKRLLQNPESLHLGGEKRDLTLFFSDLAGFTSLSEVMEPEALVRSLNEYLDRVTEVVHAHEGTLDKYVGDAIVAFWGAPDPRADHAMLACRAALASQNELQKFRAKLKMAGLPDFNARIGLNTGPVTVGFVGARKRFQYTVIGDDVNLASRLEGANKAYGTSILISEGTRSAVGEAVLAREVDLLRVKGKQRPVRVYELMALAAEATEGQRRIAARFGEALALYRSRRWAEAQAAFEAILAGAPDDGPSRVYAGRCAHVAAEPPPEDWDGVYVMKTK